MFECTVAGVDPGTASVGMAVLAGPARRPEIRWAGTIRTPSGLPGPERLRRIHAAVGRVLDEHRPEVLAVERLMWGRNAPSGMEVARASGVIVLAGAERGMVVEEYAPLEVKMAVTGVGNAPKETVRRSLEQLLGLSGVPAEPDAADAVAVAVCHLQQTKLRGLVKRAAR
jgi:crossover junction endodeoxyribonuclease RuvC